MTSITHFVTGGAAAGTLKHLIGPEGTAQVVALDDPLACGPLCDYGTAAGNKWRGEWLQMVCELLDEQELWTWLSGQVGLPALHRYREADATTRCVVWVGQSVDEQLMLRAICAALPQQRLWIADVTGQLDEDILHAVGACPPETLATIIPAPLDPRHQNALAAEWCELTEQGNLVRTWDGTRIQIHDETFFDRALLAAIGPGPRVAARVVGQVLGEYAGQVGDTFLCYRILTLMAQGQVRADQKGPLLGLRLSPSPEVT